MWYADDTNVLIPANNVSGVIHEAGVAMDLIKTWLDSNKMYVPSINLLIR